MEQEAQAPEVTEIVTETIEPAIEEKQEKQEKPDTVDLTKEQSGSEVSEKQDPLVSQQEEIAQLRMQQDILAIKQAYPDEKADHVALLGDEFLLYVGMGVGAVKAYELSHMDEILGRKAASARQKAIDSAQSKSHLRVTGGSVGTSVEIPSATLSLYHKLNPKATDEQIRKHYEKEYKNN